MKKLLLAAVVLGFSSFVFAQDVLPPAPPSPALPAPPPPGDKQSEEIIIRNKGDKDLNMTVQINGDSIYVNGKPLNEFIDSQVTIRKRKMMMRDEDKTMAFDFDNGNFQRQWDEAAKKFHGQFKKDKEISRPFLGVTTEKATNGVKVVEVVAESAAEKAGLKEGDIITKINDKVVDNPDALADIVKSQKPQDEVKISYIRNNKNKTVKAVLGERKETKDMAFSFHGPGMETFEMPEQPEMPEMPEMMEHGNFDMMPHPKKLGIKIQDTEDGTVKVIAVEDSSAAAKAGIQPNDIITEIDGDKINNTDEARDHLHPEEGKNLYKITVNRNGTELNFDVKIPKKLKTADL